MKAAIKYIELKTGYSDNGPAWIGLVSFSKSGKTLYFNNSAFQSLKGNGIKGNFYDVELGDEYWISSVKKNQQDRLISGGFIFVERRVLEEYLRIIRKETLDLRYYEIVELNEDSPIGRINTLVNQISESESSIDKNRVYLDSTEMTDKELDYFIEVYRLDAIEGRYLKGRKKSRNEMNKLLKEKKSRGSK